MNAGPSNARYSTPDPPPCHGFQYDGSSGRKAAVAKAAEALGGKLEAYYFALGEHDVVAILDLPDTVSATALALTVSGTGLVRTKTTVLMTVEETDKALAKKVAYRGPGK